MLFINTNKSKTRDNVWIKVSDRRFKTQKMLLNVLQEFLKQTNTSMNQLKSQTVYFYKKLDCLLKWKLCFFLFFCAEEEEGFKYITEIESTWEIKATCFKADPLTFKQFIFQAFFSVFHVFTLPFTFMITWACILRFIGEEI